MEALKNKMITFLFRHKLPQNSSIEELFLSVSQNIQKNGYVCQNVQLPRPKATLNSIIANLKFLVGKKYDLCHITGDVHYIAPVLSANTILTIHDVGSALRGSLVKRFFIKLFWFWIPALSVKKITVISSSSKMELIRIIPFAKNKIRVIYNPVNPLIKSYPIYTVSKKPNILHIGTKPNKNLERTIQALSDIDCKFIIIGKLNKNQLELLRTHEIDYINEYFISYDKIVEHYLNCDLLTFVSTYEGFGMPIIEAQKTGRPVITSNISSMPEIAGDGAYLVDPYNIDEIKKAILKVIRDDGYRKVIINKGLDNAKRFDIEKITTQYLDLYMEILA